MNRYAQLQYQIEIALENYIREEQLYVERDRRDQGVNLVIPEELYRQCYRGFFNSYMAAKEMSVRLIASLPEGKRGWKGLRVMSQGRGMTMENCHPRLTIGGPQTPRNRLW